MSLLLLLQSSPALPTFAVVATCNAGTSTKATGTPVSVGTIVGYGMVALEGFEY